MSAYTDMAVKALELALSAIDNSDSLEEAKQRIQKAINNIKKDD